MTMFCFMIIAVIWMSAAITKRFSDKSYFVLNTTALLFATADAAWGLVHNKSVPCAPRGMMVIITSRWCSQSSRLRSMWRAICGRKA